MDNIVIKSVLVDTISSIFNGELVEQQVKSGKLKVVCAYWAVGKMVHNPCARFVLANLKMPNIGSKQ